MTFVNLIYNSLTIKSIRSPSDSLLNYPTGEYIRSMLLQRQFFVNAIFEIS